MSRLRSVWEWARARLVVMLILLSLVGFAVAIVALVDAHGQDRQDFQRLQTLLCDQEGAFASLPKNYSTPQSKTGQQLIDVALKIQSTGQTIHLQLRCDEVGRSTP